MHVIPSDQGKSVRCYHSLYASAFDLCHLYLTMTDYMLFNCVKLGLILGSQANLFLSHNSSNDRIAAILSELVKDSK